MLLGLVGSLWADCRWINEGETHLWSDPGNWKDGRIPTSEDAFLSTPYYFDLSTWRWDYTDPEWLTYENPDHRCAIQDGIDAVCKKAKNMRQIYIDITGGSLTILNEWKIGQDDGPSVIVNMSGGVVNVGTFMDICGWSEWKYQD